jgi:hypothetical protein
MGQKSDRQKDKKLFSQRVEFDLPKRISEVHELRERVRLAEMASAGTTQNISRPIQVDSRTK